MKKKYIQPTVSVSFVVVESQLLAGGSGPGAQKEQNDDFITFSKKHDFSFWDDDFDEEDNSESNSSSKSLWEN